jgi:CRP-like cAMP-binding protein
MLEVLVDQPTGCAMRCLPVEARQPLPLRWRGEYSLALVRRGIIVRQRVDRGGRVASIDIAGPSSAIPIAARTDDGVAGYAVSDSMLCLVTAETLETAVTQQPPRRRAATRGAASAAQDLALAQSAMRERVERIAEALTRTAALSRVACLLLAIADTLSPAIRLSTIPSTIQQRDLAALCALRHESVCRSIAELESRGIVARTPNGLYIVDRAELEII